MRPSLALLCAFLGVLGAGERLASAQEPIYFVTYSDEVENPRNLEAELQTTTGFPKANHPSYTAPWLELEYGVTGQWTAALYFEGVTAQNDGAGFTGWRWENRVRPLKGEHWVNPVLYIEYEHINEASRIQKEIVGTGGLPFEPIAALRQNPAHELEGRLILSSDAHGWNVSENFIIEKNWSADEGLEFGYSVGVSRGISRLARGTTCHACLENVVASIEAYGGLGTTKTAGLNDTRHYIAPVLGWHVSDRMTIKVSNGFGVTRASDRYLFRLGWSYDLSVSKGQGQ